MEEDRARNLDIEQMIKRKLRDTERVYDLSKWLSTEWPKNKGTTSHSGNM